jgi:hypothetical protein
MAWEPSRQTSTLPRKFVGSVSSDGAVLCGHGEAAAQSPLRRLAWPSAPHSLTRGGTGITRKPGANQGRQFYVCPRTGVDQCRTFREFGLRGRRGSKWGMAETQICIQLVVWADTLDEQKMFTATTLPLPQATSRAGHRAISPPSTPAKAKHTSDSPDLFDDELDWYRDDIDESASPKRARLSFDPSQAGHTVLAPLTPVSVERGHSEHVCFRARFYET